MASSEISSVTAQAPQVQQPRQSTQPEAAKKDISEAERERQLRAQQQAQAQAQEQKPVTNTQGQVTGTIINTTA
jgi:hypothetical protein